MSWFREKPLGTITLADIERLVELKVRESRVIDFKKGPTLDKLSLAKDLSSFANAQGGDLVYGVDEQDLVASEVVGFDEKVEATTKRILDVACHCIEPRVTGLGFQPVALSSGKNVLVVRVPQSLDAPHRVELTEERFWVRDDSAQHRMSSTEIKALVTRMMTFEERAEAWRAERWSIQTKTLTNGAQKFAPVIVVHGHPLSASSGTLDLRQRASGKLNLSDQSVLNALSNLPDVPQRSPVRSLDGIAVTRAGDHPREYRWFRDGRFEIVRWLGRTQFESEVARGGPPRFSATTPREDMWIGTEVVEVALRSGLDHARALESFIGSTSWLFMVTLVGVNEAEYRYSARDSSRRVAGATFDRHNIPVPPAFAEELPSTPEAEKAFWSETLDIIAQSANLPEHPRR